MDKERGTMNGGLRENFPDSFTSDVLGLSLTGRNTFIFSVRHNDVGD